ncbi:MAG TPA: hypothetical protein VFI11_03315, partial [Anaerolineales bacterium]|nr:hypothetical protein [Anaerolineales bacterium]
MNAFPITTRSTSSFSAFRAGLRNILRSDVLWVSLAFAALTSILFLQQNRVVGWEPGYNELQPGHHGWVSSHTLAIIAHATPENGFVGYALATSDENGERDYDYFDRYPVFFSAGMHAVLSWKPRLSTQVFLAKQMMNAVFVLTVVVAYLLLRKISGQTLASMVAAVLGVSSRYLLFYKDMVHYDQPALLGMLLLTLAIAVHKVDSKKWPVYAATLTAVSLGRGYASISVLLVWLGLEALRILRERGMSFAAKFSGVWKLDAFRALLLGTGWAALNLLYNIQVEAARRGIPLGETSIVQSAVNRLALNQDFNQSYLQLLNWRYFIADELVRLVRWSFPIWGYEGSVALSAVILVLMLAVIVWFGRSLDAPRRMVLTVLVVSGAVWLAAMRNLSAFHDYTAMYFLGIPLALYLAVTRFFRLPRTVW